MDRIPFTQKFVGAVLVTVVGGMIVHAVTEGPVFGPLRSVFNRDGIASVPTTQASDEAVKDSEPLRARPPETAEDRVQGTGTVQEAIGLVTERDGRGCLSIQAANLPRGTPVYVVTLDYPQRVLSSSVTAQRTTGCEFGLEPSYRSYGLNTDGWGFSYLDLAIGLIGVKERPRHSGSLVVAPFGGRGEGTTFRHCTSSEGLHVTAWQGSERIWHVYYYLGYDTEPTCRDDEV